MAEQVIYSSCVPLTAGFSPRKDQQKGVFGGVGCWFKDRNGVASHVKEFCFKHGKQMFVKGEDSGTTMYWRCPQNPRFIAKKTKKKRKDQTDDPPEPVVVADTSHMKCKGYFKFRLVKNYVENGWGCVQRQLTHIVCEGYKPCSCEKPNYPTMDNLYSFIFPNLQALKIGIGYLTLLQEGSVYGDSNNTQCRKKKVYDNKTKVIEFMCTCNHESCKSLVTAGIVWNHATNKGDAYQILSYEPCKKINLSCQFCLESIPDGGLFLTCDHLEPVILKDEKGNAFKDEVTGKPIKRYDACHGFRICYRCFDDSKVVSSIQRAVCQC